MTRMIGGNPQCILPAGYIGSGLVRPFKKTYYEFTAYPPE
jgi:hypothetical protein